MAEDKPEKKKTVRATRTKVDQTEWDTICEEFPWMREPRQRRRRRHALRVPRLHGRRRHREGSPGNSDESSGSESCSDYEKVPKDKKMDELSDGALDGVIEELVEHRQGWAWHDDKVFDFGVT